MGLESRRRSWERGLRLRARLRRSRRRRQRLMTTAFIMLLGALIGYAIGWSRSPDPRDVALQFVHDRAQDPSLDPVMARTLRAFWRIEVFEAQSRQPSGPEGR